MPSDPQDFHALIERVLARDEDAARELTEEYGPHLIRAVRRHLNQKLRAKFDSRDFVQDVWASFFADLPTENTFKRPSDLAAFLACLARNKVVDTVRQRMTGQKFNVNREQSLDEGRSSSPQHQLAARQPTASMIAMTEEQWEQLLQRQPPVYRRILILLREGASSADAAREVGVSERTVRRLINKLRCRSAAPFPTSQSPWVTAALRGA